MASEVEIPDSLVTQAPQDAIGILEKEKEAKNDAVIKEENDKDTDGECFLYPPSVGKVATEAHRESEKAEHEEILISDSNENNLQMDSKNAASGESEAEIEHVNKGNQETIDTNVSNHNNLHEVQAVEVPIYVPNQTSETFEKDKKSESNPETALPLDPMALLGKVEAPITEGECSVVHCSAEVAGSEEKEQNEKKFDGASVVSQTAFSSVENEKELTSQSEKEVMEAIQPPESTDVEEKVCLQQVGEDKSSHLFEENGQDKNETDEKSKDELTVKNTMGSDESENGATTISSSKIDTEVITEENLKANSYELVSNDRESLQKEEQHLGLVSACSEKEISSELIDVEECIEKQAIKQMETEKKCEEESVTMISEDILADETTEESTATEESEMESFVVDSEIQEKEIDNFNASGVPEDNTLETDAKEMNSPENISKNENEAVDALEIEAQSREKQETEDPFEEETHNSNASEEGKPPQPAVLEGSLVETATSKDLYSETSIVGKISEEILVSGDEKKLEDDDDDECRNLPMEKEQHESAISVEESTHEVAESIMPDSNARELVGSLQDNKEGQKSVEETSNHEGSTRPLEEPTLEKPKEVVSVQEAEACQHENDEPRELDKASSNFEEVINEENNSETSNTTKEEDKDSLSKEKSIVKEITEEASECHNTTQESTEKVEVEICQAEGISNIQKKTSEEDNASDNQITDAEKEITESTSAAHIVVEEKDMDGDVVNGTKSTGSEDVVTENIEKVHELDEIIDKEMVTSEEYTSEKSIDKHTEDEKQNTIQETDQKTENVTDNIPEDLGQVSATDIDILTTEGRTSIDENPSTEKERTNQEDHLNESTLEVDVEDSVSESSNIKGQGCTPVAVVSDKPEAVEDANAEGELKQVTFINVEAVGKAIDAEDSISKHDDDANISNDGLEVLKGKGEVPDGDSYCQENDSPVSDDVCTKENTEPDDAIEKSKSCSDSAATSKSATSAEANQPGTDESQDIEHEDDEPVMNSHLEEHVSITESDIEVEVKDSANIEEVGQKAREVDLEETLIIEREVEEDVPYIEAEKSDYEDKLETVQEDSSQHCDELNTTESDNNELPKEGQEKEQVRFDDIHGTNLVEDAEIGTYRSEEKSNEKEIEETAENPIHQAESFSTFNDSQQVFEVQDEANKELENVKDENSNSIIDVSAKEISESVVTIDKNDHQTNLEADNNIPSVEANKSGSDETIRVMKYQDADTSEHLSQEVHKEQGLSATEVVTEINDDKSANDEENLNKIIDAVEVQKLECGTESSNLTVPNKDETDATGRTLNDPVVNCVENVIVDGREAKTLNAEVPEIDLAKCSLEKAEDETQLTDEKSQVSEGDTKEEDFQQVTTGERTEIEVENESHICMSDDKHVHESEKMSELHKSDEIGGPHLGTDENIAEGSLVPNDSGVEVQNHQISTVVEVSGGNNDEKMAILDQEEPHEPTYEKTQTVVVNEVAGIHEEGRTDENDVSETKSSIESQDIEVKENQECDHDEAEDKNAEASAFDVTDDKTEEGQQGTHCDDITNKIETVNILSEEPGVSEEVTALETMQLSEVNQLLEEDNMASEVGIPPQGVTNEKLEDVPSGAAQNTALDVKDGLSNEVGAPNGDKMSEECVPIDENQSPIDVSDLKFDNQQVVAEEGCGGTGCETETVNIQAKETSPSSGLSVTEKVSEGCEPIQESPLQENIVKEGIEEQKLGEINGEIASKPDFMKVGFKDDMPEETSAKTDESEPLEESQSSKDVLISEFNIPTDVKDNLVMETGGSVPSNVSKECLDSQECHSKFDILNDEDIADTQKEEIFTETACETETLNAEITDDLPEESRASVEKMTREVVLDEIESKTEAVNVEIMVDVPEEPDSLSVEKASEGMPSQEDQSPIDVLNSDVDVPKGDQELKENDFDEAACEGKRDDSIDISCGVAPLQAQVTDDLLKEPDVSNDAYAAKTSEECAALEENQSSKDVVDSEFDVSEDETKKAEKDGEVCSEIAYKTNTVDVENNGDLSEETSTIVNEETSSQEIEKVVDVDTMKADENVKEKTSQQQLEQSSSLKIEYEQGANDTGEKEANVQVADETERQVDDSNVGSEQSMDMKQVQEVDISGITDKSSTGESRESPLEFEVGDNQPSNNSESVINSPKQETTTETGLQFSSELENANVVTPQTDATSENQEQNESSEQSSDLYDQELTISQESMEEKQGKEETNELITIENQSEIECEKHEATKCDTGSEKNIEPDGTLQKQSNSSEALDITEKNTGFSNENWEEIAEKSAEDKTIGAIQNAKELESNDECPGKEPTQEDFQQATREITVVKVNSVESEDDAPGIPSETIASKLDEVEVQRDIKEHERTGCNEIDESSSVKDKEVINPDSDDDSYIDKPNQHEGIGVETTELLLDNDENIQNHDDSAQEREVKGEEYHVNNVSEEEVKSVGKPHEAETIYTEEKCTSRDDYAPHHQEGDSEDVITQEVDVSTEKLQEKKQQILEKEEPREQENVQKDINICSNVENEEEITASDIITREIDNHSAANDGILHHLKVKEDENLASTDKNADHSEEPEELSAADIIANQISLDIEREEQQKQLSSEQLQEQEATVVGSDTSDIDNHALKENTVAMNFDEITRMSCLPKDGQTELGVVDSECRLEETDTEEEQKTICSELVAETENTVTTGVDKATTCDAVKHEESKAQSQREDGQNTEISPEDGEKQEILAKASETPEEKVLCHEPEAAPQDSQNESPDSSENVVTAGELDTDNRVNLSSVVSQMDEEAIQDSNILHTPEVQEQPLEVKGVTIESTDNAVTDGEREKSAEVDLSSISSQRDEAAITSFIIQSLVEKEVTIESPDNTENAATAGEREKGAEVDLSSISSQKNEEAMKSCIVPHMQQVQEQMTDQKGVSMEDDKDKDLHETRQMEDTGNDHDDTIRSRLIVDEEKLLENHFIVGSTHEKGKIEADTTKSVPAEQDQSGSCPTENTVKETSPMAGVENSNTGNDKIDEKGFSEPKGEQTNDTKTGSIRAESTNISVSDTMQRSSAQTCQTDEEKTPDKEDVAAEELQIDEEKDEEAMRDFDIKATNRKSHNILSGVGSKVKHSISKVKKAITCSSSQFASDEVFVKLNKNKKS